MRNLTLLQTANCLTDSMQLADELPMIYTTCVMAFATFSYSRTRRFSIVVGFALAGLALFITVSHTWTQTPLFQLQDGTNMTTDLLSSQSRPIVPPTLLCLHDTCNRYQRHVYHGIHPAARDQKANCGPVGRRCLHEADVGTVHYWYVSP